MPLLNGQYVDASAIDPQRHRYLGMWRPPVNPLAATSPGVAVIICSCGAHLRYVHEGEQHYLRGCCDTPQYVDIKS